MTGRPDPATAVPGRPRPRTPEVVDLDHAFDGNGLYGMRAAVAAHGERLGARGERLERLLIVASEMANNAVRHGGGTGRLRLWRSGERFYCQVSDHGPGLADAHVGLTPPDPHQSGGRGVWIIRQLSDSVDIFSGPDGTVVTAVLPVSPGEDGEPSGTAPAGPADG